MSAFPASPISPEREDVLAQKYAGALSDLSALGVAQAAAGQAAAPDPNLRLPRHIEQSFPDGLDLMDRLRSAEAMRVVANPASSYEDQIGALGVLSDRYARETQAADAGRKERARTAASPMQLLNRGLELAAKHPGDAQSIKNEMVAEGWNAGLVTPALIGDIDRMIQTRESGASQAGTGTPGDPGQQAAGRAMAEAAALKTVRDVLLDAFDSAKARGEDPMVNASRELRSAMETSQEERSWIGEVASSVPRMAGSLARSSALLLNIAADAYERTASGLASHVVDPEMAKEAAAMGANLMRDKAKDAEISGQILQGAYARSPSARTGHWFGTVEHPDGWKPNIKEIIADGADGLNSLLIGVGAGVAGTAVGGPGVGLAAGVLAGGGVDVASVMQGVYDDLVVNKKVDPEKARMTSAGVGLVYAPVSMLLESIPLEEYLSKSPVGKVAKTKLVEFVANRMGARLAKAGVASMKEGATEVMQEAWGDFSQWAVANDEDAFKDWMSRYAKVGVLGAGLGGGVEMVLGHTGRGAGDAANVPVVNELRAASEKYRPLEVVGTIPGGVPLAIKEQGAGVEAPKVGAHAPEQLEATRVRLAKENGVPESAVKMMPQAALRPDQHRVIDLGARLGVDVRFVSIEGEADAASGEPGASAPAASSNYGHILIDHATPPGVALDELFVHELVHEYAARSNRLGDSEGVGSLFAAAEAADPASFANAREAVASVLGGAEMDSSKNPAVREEATALLAERAAALVLDPNLDAVALHRMATQTPNAMGRLSRIIGDISAKLKGVEGPTARQARENEEIPVTRARSRRAIAMRAALDELARTREWVLQSVPLASGSSSIELSGESMAPDRRGGSDAIALETSLYGRQLPSASVPRAETAVPERLRVSGEMPAGRDVVDPVYRLEETGANAQPGQATPTAKPATAGAISPPAVLESSTYRPAAIDVPVKVSALERELRNAFPQAVRSAYNKIVDRSSVESVRLMESADELAARSQDHDSGPELVGMQASKAERVGRLDADRLRLFALVNKLSALGQLKADQIGIKGLRGVEAGNLRIGDSFMIGKSAAEVIDADAHSVTVSVQMPMTDLSHLNLDPVGGERYEYRLRPTTVVPMNPETLVRRKRSEIAPSAEVTPYEVSATSDAPERAVERERRAKETIAWARTDPEVEAVRSRAEAIPSTELINTPERETLRQEIADRIYEKGAGDRVRSATRRTAFVVIGPPGAGKSSTVRRIVAEHGALEIDPDHAKAMLPEFAGGIGANAVHAESVEIFDRVFKRAMEAGDNVAISRIGGNPIWLREALAILNHNGYRANLILVDVPADVAARRVWERFQSGGQGFVDPVYAVESAPKPKAAYDEVKREYHTWQHLDNDVPRGEQPRLVERSRTSPDLLGEPAGLPRSREGSDGRGNQALAGRSPVNSPAPRLQTESREVGERLGEHTGEQTGIDSSEALNTDPPLPPTPDDGIPFSRRVLSRQLDAIEGGKFDAAKFRTELRKAISDPEYAAKIGMPDLANPGRNVGERNVINAADEVRGRPAKQSRESVMQAAQAGLDAAGAVKVRERLLSRVRSGALLDAKETVQAATLAADAAADIIANGDENLMGALTTIVAYRQSGTDQARALAIRGRALTGAERNQFAVAQVLVTPPQRVQAQLDAAHRELRKADTDAGRAAALAKIDALKEEAAKSIRKIRADLQAAGYDPARFNDPEYVKGLMSNPDQAARVMRIISAAKASGVDKVAEYWRNAILSGPLTQAANIVGNAGYVPYKLLGERALQAVVGDTARALGLNAGDTPTLGEFAPMMKAVGPALARAGERFLQTFRTERATLVDDITGQGAAPHEAAADVAIGGKTGRVVRVPQRLLSAADEWFKTWYTHLDAAGRAWRSATEQGLQGAERWKYVEKVMGDTSSPEWLQAIDGAVEATFQKPNAVTKLGVEIRRSLDRAAGPLPVGTFVVPFVTTPVNIALAAGKLSPLSIIEAGYHAATGQWKGNPGKVTADLVRVAVAMSIQAALWALTEPDKDGRPMLTGTRPKSIGERGLAYRAVPPMSIRIGNTWYSYARIEPFATLLAATADVMGSARERAADGVGISENLAQSVLNVGASFGDQLEEKTFLSGLADLFAVVRPSGNVNATKRAADYASRFTTSWVPNLIRQTARATDPAVRDYSIRQTDESGLARSALTRTAQLSLPIEAVGAPARYDLWGRPISARSLSTPAADFVYRLVVPVKQAGDEPSPLDLMILRYNQRVPDDAEFWPQEPARTLSQTDHRTGVRSAVRWSDDEYQTLVRDAGQAAAARLLKMRLDFDNPGQREIQAVRDVLSEERQRVTRRLLRERKQ